MSVLQILLLIYFGINTVLAVLLFIILRQSNNAILRCLLYSIIALFVGLPILLFSLIQWAFE